MPNLPSALPEVPEALGPHSTEGPLQVAHHLNMVQAKRRVLINEEQIFKQKYEKYTKILN